MPKLIRIHNRFLRFPKIRKPHQQRLQPVLKIKRGSEGFEHPPKHDANVGGAYVGQSLKLFNEVVGVVADVNVRGNRKEPLPFPICDHFDVAA